MIRREFLKSAAAVTSTLVTTTSYARPCAPRFDGVVQETCGQLGVSNLEQRANALTETNTPQRDVSYFLSEDGGPQEIPNNRTAGQTNGVTWQVQGIYFDRQRRVMHQLDKQHRGNMEHAIYDELANTWMKVNATLLDSGPSHWRQQFFVPETGFIYHHQEGENKVHFYNPNSGTWNSTPNERGLTEDAIGPHGFGYHPNLFGQGKPGLVVATPFRWFAWDLTEQSWHTLHANRMGSSNPLFNVRVGEGWYIPDRDELLMTSRSHPDTVDGENTVYALAAGTGLESQVSVSNSAEIRFSPPKRISAESDNDKCYACMHPRQPNVLLAFDAANSNVYYTDDAATTRWKTAQFTHPFASELDTTGKATVGTLPYHGVVAGAAGGSGGTRFVFWRPPLV